MSRSPHMHSNFFSSLKQLEKRLKIENPSSTNDSTLVPSMPLPPPISAVQPSSSSHTQGFTMTESLSSPIYLFNPDQQTKQSSKLDDSELAGEFISVSHKFSTTQDDPILQPQFPENQPDMLDEPEDSDDIQLLMQLLHLPSLKEESIKSQEPRGVVSEMNGRRNGDEKRCCDDEFYAKVVGIKGPQCQLEVERLDSWIRHLENGDGVKTFEPLRLAHLLLAKAASISEGEDRDRGLEFPSTIQDFLLNDPPSNYEKI